IIRLMVFCFFFSSRRRHTRFSRDWSSDVCSSDLSWCGNHVSSGEKRPRVGKRVASRTPEPFARVLIHIAGAAAEVLAEPRARLGDRKSTRLNSSHVKISYAVFCLKKKTITPTTTV